MIPNGGTFGGQHTLRDFHMIPKSKITFAPPEVRTETVDVPGMMGELDMTEALGSVSYRNRRGTVEFLVMDADEYATVYSSVLTHFHGQRMNIVLDDDPAFFYTGRLSVNDWRSVESFATLALDYDLDPLKRPIHSTISQDWLWNDLFNTVIYYGIFDVAGEKARNLLNPSGYAITPKFTCSAPMTVVIGGNTYTLPQGTTTAPGFFLAPGSNQATFKGTGRVAVDYDAGAQL